jgi:hypothetical protein
MQSALERYEDIDYTFAGSREGKLLKVCTSGTHFQERACLRAMQSRVTQSRVTVLLPFICNCVTLLHSHAMQ